MAPRQRNRPMTTYTEEQPFVEDSSSSSSFDDICDTSLLSEEEKVLRKKAMTTKSTAPPTPSITESDLARDNHDYFNIIALVRPLFYAIEPRITSFTIEEFPPVFIALTLI